jgi:Na+/H+ antiporter NhaC
MKFWANLTILAIVVTTFAIIAAIIKDQLNYDCAFVAGWIACGIYFGVKYK